MKHETVFLTAQAYYSRIFDEMSRAQSRIDVNVYILKDDSIGQKLIGHLQSAAERGVRCKLLVDGFGARDWVREVGRTIEIRNLEIRVFNPLSFFWYLDLLSWWRLGKKFLFKINRRDHKKLVLIDSDLCFIGSINFSEASLQQKEMTVLSKKAAPAGDWYFEYTWIRSRGTANKVVMPFIKKIPKPKNFDTSPIRYNYNLINRRKNVNNLYQSIDQASHKIWFTTPYFIPTVFLIKHLVRGAKRGVDVRILLPKKIDLPFMRWVAQYYYPVFVDRGVKIYEYQGDFLHQKISIIDDNYIIGSSNVDHRSFFTNLELDVRIQTQEAKEIIFNRVQEDFANAKLVDPSKIKMSFWQKAIRNLVIFLEKRLSS